MTLAAIGQHIQLLEACGLVKTAKVGRVRTVTMVPETLRSVESWFESHRKRWEQRFDRLGALLFEEEDGGEPLPAIVTSKNKKGKSHE